MLNGTSAPRPTGRVAVVEESVLQRHRIEQLLSDVMGLEVMHGGTALPQLMTRLRHIDRAQWPHLLVLGIPAEPGQEDTLRAVRSLRREGIRVLFLSASRSRKLTWSLRKNGVDGLVSTMDSEQEFLDVVGSVLAGGTAITARVESLCETPPEEPKLSDQEHRVFVLYASGLEITEVAAAIGVQPDTARKYLSRVREKYTKAGHPARTKLELARLAWAQGYGRLSVQGMRRRETAAG